MTFVSCSQLIFLLLIVSCCIIDADIHRHRRQTIDGTNRNIGVPQQKPLGSIPLNNVPFNPTNNLNTIVSNERNNQLVGAPQPPLEPARSRGFYNSPAFQSPPFTGGKPSGWFGTSHTNWVSSRDSEVDKNKLAAEKNPLPNNLQANNVQTPRVDGGPFFLAKVAQQYASKGAKMFDSNQFDTNAGRGSVCFNHENFDGFTYGRFPCPLPASTGMNQKDQFCCGLANYQYCCNAQEFSQSQRGAFADQRYIGEQRFPRRPTYSSSSKRVLAVIIPIASFIVLAGIAVLVFLYYKNFRKEQNRCRKPTGAIRLEDNYSIVPQELPIEKLTSTPDES